MNSFETLRKIIDNNVTNRVDHVAFRLLGKTYTNQFLAEESKRIEALLHASLTSPVTSSGQIRVGVCLGRNQYFLPAFYTLLRNGYTYIPLDPDLPEDRMNYIIEDSQMNLILTTPDLVHKFKTCQIVDVTAKATEVHLGERPANQPHLAYIMFTSGTTGKPKGVPISYDNLLYFLQCIDDELHYLGSDGRVLFFTSIGFDVSICEIMGSLYSGSTLCIATEDIRSDGGQLYQFINQEQITYACLTPSLMNILPSMEFSHMKVLQSVGEPMIAKVAEKGTGKNYLFVDSYGPTDPIKATMTTTAITTPIPIHKFLFDFSILFIFIIVLLTIAFSLFPTSPTPSQDKDNPSESLFPHPPLPISPTSRPFEPPSNRCC